MTAVAAPPEVASPRPAAHVTAPSRAFELRRERARNFVLHAALIAIGATSAIQVIGFSSTMLSPVCLLLVPALLLMRPTLGQWVPLVLAVAGFIAFFVSSQLNDLSITDQRVQQWASFGLYFVGFIVLVDRNVAQACSLLCGIAIGAVLYYESPGNTYESLTLFADVWKYAWAPWVTIVVLYALTWLRVNIPLQAVVLVLLAGFSMDQNYRSHAIVCLGAAAALLVGWISAGKVPRWLQLAVVAAIGTVLYVVAPKIAVTGVFGDAIARKTELQMTSGVPMILAGRTESPLSIAAIMERPWFGWGSADNISAEVFDRAKSIAIWIGFDPTLPIETSWYLSNGAVSLHSALLTAWAEGGVIAALLPLALLFAALAIVWNAVRYGRWAALVVTVAVQAAWDLLFSPTSYNILPTFAMLAVLFAACHLPKKSEAAPLTEES